MTEFNVTAVQSPDLDDVEVRFRLARVYSLILETGRECRAQCAAEQQGTSDEVRGNELLPREHTESVHILLGAPSPAVHQE